MTEERRAGAKWADPLVKTVIAASVPSSGEDVALRPTEAERSALSQALGLDGVPALKADYRLARRAGGIIKVTGRIVGVVRPFCVVSLEPFDLAIDEPVEVRFAEPQAVQRRRVAEEDIGLTSDDPPDPVENGVIDLGRVTTEFLSLAVPPFPRKPGVEHAPEPEAGRKESPFAVLQKTARPPKGSD